MSMLQMLWVFAAIGAAVAATIAPGADAQSSSGRVVAKAAASTPRLYCGRLRIQGRWVPETTSCKPLAEWRKMLDRDAAREKETAQIINIGPGQR
jgi:hypothetical protein